MKYIKKDTILINLEKCLSIKIDKWDEINWELVFENENDYKRLLYETEEEVRQDLMKIEAFITDERGLLKL